MSNNKRRILNDEILQFAVTRLSPQPQWAVIIDTDGQLVASYPILSPNDVEEDSKAGLSAGMFSLSERLTFELRSGALKDCVVYGTEGIFIIMVMPDNLVLSTNFAAIPSLDDTLPQLQDIVAGIDKLLKALS